MVIWNHENKNSRVEKIILSTKEEIVPVAEINSWEALDDFLQRNYPKELTWWGKFCWFMNS